GRVILGYSDNRLAIDLTNLTINNTYPINGVIDTARLHSVILEFNVESGIDTALSNGRDSMDLPLVRLQVLFKKGTVGTGHNGWPVLPFVPFRSSLHPNNTGWWAVLDTVITKSVYNSL